ncbi:MAG: hypothetical protein H6595_04070 [Flavobacteriales bacterium]|nr:hypothetical protein [Flavobacteriales bacterium]MCB9166636.1 hypothetical protein [Flavobacteriales bacterium]
MRNHLHKLATTAVAALLAVRTFASSAAPDWLEETFYRSGKINTVIAVVTVVLLGLAFWMFRSDRRLARLEKRMNERHKA